MYQGALHEYTSSCLRFRETVIINLALAILCPENLWTWHILSICNVTDNTSINMARSQKPRKDPFINLTADQASGERNTISPHSALAKIYVDKLVHSEEQKKSITDLYQIPASTWDLQYRSNFVKEQAAALAVLQELKLDVTSLNALDNRWSVVWNNRERKMKKENVRILYQW